MQQSSRPNDEEVVRLLPCLDRLESSAAYSLESTDRGSRSFDPHAKNISRLGLTRAKALRTPRASATNGDKIV
jgi:hypothetical protein